MFVAFTLQFGFAACIKSAVVMAERLYRVFNSLPFFSCFVLLQLAPVIDIIETDITGHSVT